MKCASNLRLVPKRILDLIGAIIGLFITTVLFVPIAVAIKLESRGPVIFSQLRVGLYEEVFTIYKFRTMIVDAEHYGSKPTLDDVRVTKVGRFLRRTSLDELPQFYNVLRGEMSLVGPRPEQLPLIPYYSPEHHLRFVVKPGITGWWQINGRKQPMYENLDYDLYYIENRTLGFYLSILLKTFQAVLKADGAV